MQRPNGWISALAAGLVVLGAAFPAPAKSQRQAKAPPSLPAKPALEEDPAIVTAVQWRDGQLQLESDHPLNARLFALEAPYRVVIDLYGAELSDPSLLQTLSIDEGPYRQLRVALHPEEGFVRFVLDCDRPTAIRLSQLASTHRLALAPFKRDKGAPLIVLAPERFGPEAPRAAYAEAYGPPVPTERLVYGPPLAVREAYGPPAPEPATSAPEPEESPAPDEPAPAWNGEPQRLTGLWLKRRRGVTTLRLEADRRLAYRIQQEWGPPRLLVRIPKGSYEGALPAAFEGIEGFSAQQDGVDWVLKLDLDRAVYSYEAHRQQKGRALELRWRKVALSEARPTVVIDAGHGGDDPGAIGPGGTYEARVNLGLATALRQALEARGGLNVVMSRTADFAVDLASRARLVQVLHPALFVSMHGNSCETPEIGGLETYYRHERSLPLARHLHADLVKALGRPDRGVRQGRLFVLRNPEIPSVLLESAYISNPQEEKLMASEPFQKELATALAGSIVDYLATPVAELPRP